ncbi:MAG TPA: DUF84 family protein [Caldithrix abyssi]|uniref:inosine/xanthosine triphosphatase n=1 Tax=Caldithrix abyssi TaxID=187145 RepID=A0A7V1LNB0_CALAY|nr:DUF84 family protein [Caldithrix abyssi]
MPVKVGIATLNPVKIKAVKNAFSSVGEIFPATFPAPVIYDSLQVDSGVAAMPLTLAEMLQGARQRVFNYLSRLEADWVVGLEGGVFILNSPEQPRPVMLQNWVYVFNGQQGSYGSSAAMPLPRSFEKELYENGKELAEVIDRFSGKKDVRSNEGAFGVLSEGLYNRESAFTQAVINALLPLCNSKYKE